MEASGEMLTRHWSQFDDEHFTVSDNCELSKENPLQSTKKKGLVNFVTNFLRVFRKAIAMKSSHLLVDGRPAAVESSMAPLTPSVAAWGR